METEVFLEKCPYDDCANHLTIPNTSETGDVIICRTVAGQEGVTGCNRNVEIKNINKDSAGATQSVELSTLEIDEDWGQ